jgi:serine protease AprX
MVSTTWTAGPPPAVHGPPERRGRRPRAFAWAAAAAAAALVVSLGAPVSAGEVPSPARVLLSTQATTSPSSAAAWVTAHGGEVVGVYAVADALEVVLPPGGALPPGTVVVPDVAFTVTSDSADEVSGATYRATVGAPSAAAGAGVTVALVDTGVADSTDLAGRVRHVNVSGGPAGDGYGHGTFMAGLIAGDGSSSDGTYTGVAPQARLLDVQVARADGSTSLSRVVAGLQAVADAAAVDSSVRVVSLALSSGSPLPPSADPLSRALGRLWARGLTVVVAAGNDGPATGTVTSPGSDPTLITVGSLDENGTSGRDDDVVSDFSARGTASGSAKPDLVAPGAHLVSLRAAGSLADVENPTSRVGSAYFTGSGTSMAEAVTAGAAAVLIGTRPALTPDTVKRLLTRTAYRSSTLEKRDGAGAGGLDLSAAVAAAPAAALVPASRRVAALAADTYGPDPADAAAWETFGQAWADGDLETVAAVWVTLSERTRRWAATAFAIAMVTGNARTDDGEYAALEKLARRWSTEAWNARRWSTDEWVARRWSTGAWDARRWSLAEFAARRWSEEDWSARRWSETAWDARRWSELEWDARRWSDQDWLAFAWVARRWSAEDWTSAAWTDAAWSARRWHDAAWSDFVWEARRWSTDLWSARRWSVSSWVQEG